MGLQPSCSRIVARRGGSVAVGFEAGSMVTPLLSRQGIAAPSCLFLGAGRGQADLARPQVQLAFPLVQGGLTGVRGLLPGVAGGFSLGSKVISSIGHEVTLLGGPLALRLRRCFSHQTRSPRNSACSCL